MYLIRDYNEALLVFSLFLIYRKESIEKDNFILCYHIGWVPKGKDDEW